ncbi:malate dehydrogenase, mitochondrial-like [Aphidius gifuensis]|uniref:malate dehydrogenase, mitochondrial-like n=1 Tax=Aphidius gifuensis TaxID=684658 RepID=UPI001CDC197D|nr:malate dehydrogenase, mitochondrial-like [Aphidius gifuensis]
MFMSSSVWKTNIFSKSLKSKDLNKRFKSMKVAVLGAGGKTGNALSFFLKHCSLIDELSLYDVTPINHISHELNHIDTKCKVTSSLPGDEGLAETLKNSKIVMITAGLPLKNENIKNDIFMTNGEILATYITQIIKHCPRALVSVATSPINKLIPLSAEVYKRFGIFDANRLFGITTLNCLRANLLSSKIINIIPEYINVPVVGGCCSMTCVPLFSQAKPSNEFTSEQISRLINAVKVGEEDDVMKEHHDNEKSSFSMGFAAARFCISLCKGLKEHRGIVECAYVRSCVLPEVKYFAAPIELGPDGVQRHLGLPSLTLYESKILDNVLPVIKSDIQAGETLALGSCSTSSEFCKKPFDICQQEISANMMKEIVNHPRNFI